MILLVFRLYVKWKQKEANPFLAEQALDPGGSLLISATLSLRVLLLPEDLGLRYKLPLTVPVLERVLMGRLRLDDGGLERPTKDHVVIHCFSRHLCNFFVVELNEGVAAGSGRLFGA